MSNAEYAELLKKENPKLYYKIRSWVWTEHMGSHAVGQRVLSQTRDRRLSALAECTAAYHVRGR
jgi:hypothetical protein